MSIGAGGVIDEFFVALGFQVDPAGLRGVNKQVDQARSSLMSLGTALTGLVTGFALKGVADIGKQFENNRIAIAGMLTALNFSPDFNSGLHDADATLQSIIRTSAALPGTADEYIEVFRAGLPNLRKVIPTVGEIVEFTNKLAAVSKTANPLLPADQIARESRELLQSEGRATNRNVLFQTLLPLMQKVQGQANLTAQSFNAMTATKRVELLRASFVGMQPAIDAASNSFDAMWGALVADTQLVVRLGTQPLFEAMKKGLAQITGVFFQADGSLTEFGQNFVDGAKEVTRWGSQIAAMLGGIVGWLVKSETGSKLLKAALIGVGLALAGLALEKTIASFGALFGVLTNVKRLLTGALFVAIALIAEDLYVFSQGGDSVTGMLVKKFGPGLTKVVGVVGVLGLLFLKFPALMNRVGFSIGMMIGRVMLALGPLLGTIIRIGVVSLATGIRMAASWALALGPLLLIAAAAFAVGYGLAFAIEKALKLAGILKGPQEPEALKNFKSDPNFKRYGDDSGDPAFLRPLAPGRHPLGSHGGAGASSTDKSSHQTTTVGHITVVSPNPHEAGKAVHRSLARNAQTGVSH